MTLTLAVRKRQGSFTLDAAFEADAGVTALFGRSGAGKSTLVNLIAGLIRPDHGRIVLDGRVLADMDQGVFIRPAARRIGTVFQEGRLFPHLSVKSNLLYGRWLTARARRWGSFDHVVELLGIGTLLARRPHDLSGGEKQRVAIGRALLASPDCLLMDEPLAALDRALKAEILPYIERLRTERRLPIIYVSHAVEEVARLADQVVLIEHGRVAAVGPVGRIFARLDASGDWDAGAVLTAQIAIASDADGLSVLEHPAGRLLVPQLGKPAGETVRIRISARDVTIAVGEPGLLSVRNRLAATVIELVPQRSETIIRLDVGGEPMVARITPPAVRELELAPGLNVTVMVKAVALDG